MSSFRIDRRDVLQLAAAGATSGLIPGSLPAADDQRNSAGVVDTNVSLFHWPFRRLPLDSTEALVQKLRSLGVVRALAGSFEGILHRDVDQVNRRLSEACRTQPELVPIGSLNPTLPNWPEDLRRCVEHYQMPGVRLHPGYHGYSLQDPRLVRLLQETARTGLFVQLAAAMEDPRTQHSLVRVADVDLTPLPAILAEVPQATVQILNARLRPNALPLFQKTPGLLCDTSRVDGTDGVPSLVNQLPTERVLFGSHAPLLIPEAALIRVHESGQLSEDQLQSVYRNSAVTRLGINV